MKKIVGIAFLTSLLLFLTINKEKQQVKIKISFPGIENGFYSTGENFDLRDILSEEILWEVYQRKKIDYPFDLFKDSLYIKQGSNFLENSLEKKEDINGYNKGNIILTSTLPIFKEENIHVDILNEFVNKKLLIKTKAEKLGDIYKSNFEDYFELEEKIYYLKIKNKNLIEYLLYKKNKVNLYEQNKYENILIEQKLFENVDLLRVENQIKNTRVVKNIDTVLSIKKEEIKKLEIKKRKHKGELDVLAFLIKNYKPENNQLIISKNSEKTSYKLGTEKKYYTDLIERITKTNVEIARITEEIKYLTEEIKLIKEDKELKDLIEQELNGLNMNFNKKIDEINIFIENENKRYYSNVLEVDEVEVIKEYNYFKIVFFSVLVFVLGLLGLKIKRFIVVNREKLNFV